MRKVRSVRILGVEVPSNSIPFWSSKNVSPIYWTIYSIVFMNVEHYKSYLTIYLTIHSDYMRQAN